MLDPFAFIDEIKAQQDRVLNNYRGIHGNCPMSLRNIGRYILNSYIH